MAADAHPSWKRTRNWRTISHFWRTCLHLCLLQAHYFQAFFFYPTSTLGLVLFYEFCKHYPIKLIPLRLLLAMDSSLNWLYERGWMLASLILKGGYYPIYVAELFWNSCICQLFNAIGVWSICIIITKKTIFFLKKGSDYQEPQKWLA